MATTTIQDVIQAMLWLLIAAGWVSLVLTGLEVDKPLSGGLPGHVDPAEHASEVPEGRWGRLGEKGAWVVFGLVGLCLPLMLWWIFTVHTK